VEGAKLNLDYTNIISPVNGTVVSMTALAGHFRLSPDSGHIAASH
jgi:multidrug resistance efflux pump